MTRRYRRYVALACSLAVLGLTLLLVLVVAVPRMARCPCPDSSTGFPASCLPCPVNHARQILFLTLGIVVAAVIALSGVVPRRAGILLKRAERPRSN